MGHLTWNRFKRRTNVCIKPGQRWSKIREGHFYKDINRQKSNLHTRSADIGLTNVASLCFVIVRHTREFTSTRVLFVRGFDAAGGPPVSNSGWVCRINSRCDLSCSKSELVIETPPKFRSFLNLRLKKFLLEVWLRVVYVGNTVI